MRGLIPIILVGLTACDPYPQVQEQGTIEAYEEYLKDYDGSFNAINAREELERLYYEKAKTENTVAAWDAYFGRFTEGKHWEEATIHRSKARFQDAEKQQSIEVWNAFINDGGASSAQKGLARDYIEALEYVPNLDIAPLRIEQVNLAEDPTGPLNGWGFFTEVTNKGPDTIEDMRLVVFYLDEDGNILDSDRWPVVAKDFGVPMEDWRYVPMKPGDKRKWDWTSGDMPEGWSKKAQVAVSSIRKVAPSK